jgi:suppressor of ftsI
MSLSPQTHRIWLRPGKNILLGFTVVAKNAVATIILEVLGSSTSLAILRCLVTTIIFALLLASTADRQASLQANPPQTEDSLPRTTTVHRAPGPRLPESPEVRGQDNVVSLTLHAVRMPNGKDAFAFDGKTIAPVIRVRSGDTLKIAYVNNLEATSNEPCATGPCMNMTNLHFHGLAISPKAPQDDVLTTLAMPGQTLHYVLDIPKDHPPGLYWYHPHPHGESHRQVLDGMSGALVVEGMERYVPEVSRLRERILVLRGSSIENDPGAAALRQEVSIAGEGCGAEAGLADRIYTVNGAVRPEIDIGSGEREFWRIVNASADRYLDLALDGQPFEIVAMDGMPLAVHEPDRPTRLSDHVLLPPAGRLEAIVSGPAPGTHTTLRTRCVNTGPAGDPNPGMVLADIVTGGEPAAIVASRSSKAQTPLPQNVDLQAWEKSEPDLVVAFTEDKNGFYINGQKYASDSDPMLRVRVGTYQHWRIVNQSDELHPMHIHQTHFLAYAVNGVPLETPEWLDTVNVSARGTVDVVMDFTNPLIKGMSLFHCHLLNHEDKGMMAKILFE